MPFSPLQTKDFDILYYEKKIKTPKLILIMIRTTLSLQYGLVLYPRKPRLISINDVVTAQKNSKWPISACTLRSSTALCSQLTSGSYSLKSWNIFTFFSLANVKNLKGSFLMHFWQSSELCVHHYLMCWFEKWVDSRPTLCLTRVQRKVCLRIG